MKSAETFGALIVTFAMWLAAIGPWLFGVVSYAQTQNWWGAVLGFAIPPVGWINGVLNLLFI